MFTLFFLHCVEELLSSFKVRMSRHVQELEKCPDWVAVLLFFCLPILFVQEEEEEDLCKSYRAAVNATAGPGEQFDVIDNKFL